MVSFDNFIMEDGTPIYQQIVLYLKRGMVSGAVTNGDELPSRRVLSALLGVNPNTVQKAYRILEDEGLIQSHTGAKSYVAVGDDTVERLRSELLREDIRALVSAMRQTGVSKETALNLIQEMWEESL